MRRLIYRIVLLTACFAGCKHRASSVLEQDGDQIAAFARQNAYYTSLVNREELQAALMMTCRYFKIEGCEQITATNERSDQHKAVTYFFSNSITLYRNAFDFGGRPHMGWLAAIIRHEQKHQAQARYHRWVAGPQARVMGNYRWEGMLEHEAWGEMLRFETEYSLNCMMKVEIEINQLYYGNLTRNEQPEAAEASNQQRMTLTRRCFRQRQAQGLPT